MKKENHDKEMAILYYNLFIGCLKYNSERREQLSKKIDCVDYYNGLKFFAEKYVDNKEQKI